MEIAFISAFYL